MMLQFFASIAATHTLRVESRPDIACSFNTSSVQLESDQTISLSAYTQTGFKFLRWEDESGATVSIQSYFTYTMPDRDVLLTAVCEYDPANPANPAKNYWNKETGEVIIDDFTPGSLSSAISSAISGSNRSDVKTIIVSGIVTNNDLGIANNYTQCSFLDLSRVTGITDIPSYAFDYTNLKTVILPHTIEKIGYEAFYQCASLTALTIYAMTPPTLENYVFYGVPDGLVVYVPVAAISQYQEDSLWGNFTILPIQQDIRSLTVSLPSDSKTDDYYQMWLELTNTKSGQRLHYVMTNSQKYTFSNIIKNTEWNVAIRNERGDIFGKINNVKIEDEDVSVEFASLSIPRTATVIVETPNHEIVTDKVQIIWNDEDGHYLSQNTTITGLPSGKKYYYSVVLSAELETFYSTPDPVEIIVSETDNNIKLILSSHPVINLFGHVFNSETNQLLRNCVINASQSFGERNVKTYSTVTDNQGFFSFSLSKVPTVLTISSEDYLSQTVTYYPNESNINSDTIPNVFLEPISRTAAYLNFTYSPSVSVEGVETEEIGYSDYKNVNFSVLNLTKKSNITNFRTQYPQLIILENVSVGDELEFTAISRNNSFLPVKSIATVDSSYQTEVNFHIKEMGKVKAHFETTRNSSVIGLLYNHDHKLVRTAKYTNANVVFSEIEDGSYTLITMGENTLFGSISDMDFFLSSGLTNEIDFVQNLVYVNSGEITEIFISEVPLFDETHYYYTNDNTSFVSNKSDVVVGNYLTLTANVFFKSEFVSRVCNCSLVIDLPESCEFVENSVMAGNYLSSYMLSGNRLSIPIDSKDNRIRFCLIPLKGGDFAPSAMIQFEMEDNFVSSFVGSAYFTAKDLSISLPSLVNNSTVLISGTVNGINEIEIYDNDVLIGKTSSSANGVWSAFCELNYPYNLSKHNIYAKVQNGSGTTLYTEVKECTVNVDAVHAKTVTMSHFNEYSRRNEVVIFDLENLTISKNSYDFYHAANFLFAVDFSTDDPESLTNVEVLVWDRNGNRRSIPAQFDSLSNRWVASSYFDSSNLPVNVDVDFDVLNTISRFDSRTIYADIDEMLSNIRNTCDLIVEREESLQKVDSTYLKEDIHNKIELLFNSSEIDTDSLLFYMEQLVDSSINISFDENSINSYIDQLDSLDIYSCNDEHIDYLEDCLFINKKLLDCPLEISELEVNEEISTEEGKMLYRISNLTTIDDVDIVNQGFTLLPSIDSTKIYYKIDETSICFIDARMCKMYSMIIEDNIGLTSGSQPRYAKNNDLDFRSWSESFKSCISTIKNAAEIIKTLKSQDDNYAPIKAFLKSAETVCNGIQCFYMTARGNIEKAVLDAYNQSIKEVEDLLKQNQQVEKEISSSINNKNKKIKQILSQNKEYNEDIELLDEMLKDPELSKSERDYYNSLKEELRNKIKANNIEKNGLEQQLKKDNASLKKIKNAISNNKKKLTGLTKKYNDDVRHLAKLPKNLVKGTKLSKAARIAGKVTGFIGVPLEAWALWDTINDLIDEGNAWLDLIDDIKRKLPCEKDKEAAEQLYKDIQLSAAQYLILATSVVVTESKALEIDIVTSAASFDPKVFITSGLFNAFGDNIKVFVLDRHFWDLIGDYYVRMMKLKCYCTCDANGNGCTCPEGTCKCKRCKKCKCKTGGKCTCGSNCKCKPKTPDVNPIMDPSGFVYEAVFSNRLEGVMATAFYKEMIEDMYGDLHEVVTKWDAEIYAQKNPLFTDENGYYNWDVPQGLWQVMFEKEGYETTYSEWLPVPPPQLEVNIAMIQNVQPVVKKVHAYDEAIEIEFDKYMMPEYLTYDQIIISQNGVCVEGDIRLLDEDSPYGIDTISFASKLRFVPKEKFKDEIVSVLITNKVRSYAGIRMQNDYYQSLMIEPEITQIVCDEYITINYGGYTTLEVTVLPSYASAGKKLNISNTSQMVLSINEDQVVLDQNGRALVQVEGILPGSAGILYKVEDYDLSALMKVDVIDQGLKTVATPTSNILSGVTVTKGTNLILTCSTPDATIYYTTDGSCPCDEAGRIVYSGPIAINHDISIKAMAVNLSGYESDIAEFTYYVDGSGIESIFEDSSIQIYPTPVEDYLTINAHGQKLQAITLTSMNGATVVFDNLSDDQTSIDVHALPSGPYVIEVFTDAKSINQIVIKK